MRDAPEFTKSPYFVPDFGNWHLLKDAPIEVKDEFEKFMSDYEKRKKDGVLL